MFVSIYCTITTMSNIRPTPSFVIPLGVKLGFASHFILESSVFLVPYTSLGTLLACVSTTTMEPTIEAMAFEKALFFLLVCQL